MTPTTTAEGKSRALSFGALGVVYFVWGSTYLAIRVGVRDVPPLVFAGTRFLIAGALLYPIARRLGRQSGESNSGGRRLGARAWLSCAVLGLLLLFAGNGGVTVAERTTPSGLAALLVATVPLWMLVFAWPLQKQRINWGSALGLAVGAIGVAVLVDNGTASGGASGVVTVLVGAACWGFGSVLARRLPLPSNAMLAAAMEMVFGGSALLICAAGTGELAQVDWSSIRATSWIAFAYL
ncbi:MAG TPA: EamA family transporter, partial [Acidimicrobiales bacterium]|nr:EamA family transporter [Acidimicrobiales bacterium]